MRPAALVLRLAVLTFVVNLVGVGSTKAQDAVVSRNVNLRNDPSTQNPAIRLLLPGAELFLLSQTKTSNYYNVQTMAGEPGWAPGSVYCRRLLDRRKYSTAAV